MQINNTCDTVNNICGEVNSTSIKCACLREGLLCVQSDVWNVHTHRLQFQITVFTLLYHVVWCVVSEKYMTSVFRETRNYNNQLRDMTKQTTLTVLTVSRI